MFIKYKGRGNGDVKKIKFEGDKEKEATVYQKMSPRNGKSGITKIFHGNGTRFISTRKGK